MRQLNDLPGKTEGFVTQLEMSGYGPNSGEITLGITEDDGNFIQVFGGLNGDNPTLYGLDDGAFAAFASLASVAYAHKIRVVCTYWHEEKLRFSALSFAS